MENLNEIERILLSLNSKSIQEDIDIELKKLVERGYKVSNLWQLISTFRSDAEFFDQTLEFLDDSQRSASVEYVDRILRFRKLKTLSISKEDYQDSKMFLEAEKSVKKELLMYLRSGREDKFCLINPKVVDKLLPHLHRFN